MAAFEAGSWVWITDEEERYLPAKVKSSFVPGADNVSVMTEDGENVRLNAATSALCTQCNEEAMNPNIDDLINISDLNEMSILHNLRIRFKSDKIYTNISSILISVNPFKLLPLYTPEMLDKYRNGSRDLPPHVFATAYNSYNNMLSEGVDQSVVISGESGAGKSEATKLILQFLTDVSSRSAGHSGNSTSLEQQILAANPILEAFGNAKTLRNNNSSRFGKLITVNFDKHGAIVGGCIINYLLEKSRVVGHTLGERNYHIFYQLLSAAATNPQLSADLKLQDPELFEFTNPRNQGVTHIEGHSDEKEFEDTQNSMDILRFSEEDKMHIFKIVAGVLHFGNVKFKVEKNETGDDGSSITNPEQLTHACEMFQVNQTNMEKFLTARTMGTKSIILVAYSVQQAQDARDAMVKRVYSEVFQIIVNKINRELSIGGTPRHKFIGVLDIFGFESFEVNSFEQLCINFCNEKLQFHFNEHIFRMEQQLYAAEGINIPGSTFVDNQPTLDLLELKTTGVFSMTDEEINVPRGSDDGLLGKILVAHVDKGKHPNMLRPKAKECKDHTKCFGILHYAGPVFYNITAFLDKNKDQLHPDIIGVLSESGSPMIRSMFAEDASAASSGGGGRGGKSSAPTKMKTLGGQFKTQLNELIATLNSTFPHFVRCMKSNDKKTGNIFTSGRMQDQLRYAGLVEVCRIRKLGFPVRRPFDEFFKRFRCCNLTAPNLDAMLAFLSSKGVLKEGEWAKGHTRVFLRTLQSAELELYRESALTQVAVVVQKHARRMIFRRRLKRFLAIIAEIRAAIVKREDAALTAAIDMTFELPWNGTHLAPIREAKALQLRVREENRVIKLLENALASQDLNELKSAVAAAASMSPPVITPLIDQATTLITKMEAELACRAGLTSAINARNLGALSEWISKGKALGIIGTEMQQATALKARMEEEEEAIAVLQGAVGKRNLAEINTAMSKCVELGITARSEVVAASQVKNQIEDEMAKDVAYQAELKKQKEAELAANSKRQVLMDATQGHLVAAMEAKDVTALNAALQEAIQLGLQTPEVANAQEQLSKLMLADEARSQLRAAIKALQVKAQSGIYASDLSALDSALAAAERVASQSGEFSELIDGRQARIIYEKHIRAREEVEQGMKENDRVKLRNALDLAENLEMTLGMIEEAKVQLRELELAYRDQKAAAGESLDEEEPYDAAEEARKRRQELARQAKYEVKNFSGLRTPDDYARGNLLGKSKIKEQFLNHQSNPIPKSIVNLQKDNNKRALEIHKDLLGYMGDKQMPFPAMLAQDVLRKGFEHKGMRDEIYMQLIKQLTNNPRPESVAKGWQLMCMCVGTFPPSFDFENYLMHYILEKRDKGRGAVVDYAKYCLRTLEAMLSHGENVGFVPQVEEILAYKERPPILATITLVDGAVLVTDLPITPDTNVGKILEMCANWLNLKDPRVNSLGIFVYDQGETAEQRDENYASAPYADLERTPRPLRSDDFMGDVIVQKARQRRKFKFVLKKKIFLPAHRYRGDDPGYERMVYLQAEDEVIIQGNVSVANENQAAYLAAISMAVCYGEDMGASVEDLLATKVIDFIAPAWRSRRKDAEWAALVLSNRAALMPPADRDPDEWYGTLQAQFVETVQESIDYGTHWFYVHKVEANVGSIMPQNVRSFPRDLILAYNADGLHIYNTQRTLLASFPYADVYRWGGSSSQFSLIMADESIGDSFEFVIITSQAADMAAIILDHIRAIMAEHAAN